MSELMAKCTDKICRLLIGGQYGVCVHPPAVNRACPFRPHVVAYCYIAKNILTAGQNITSNRLIGQLIYGLAILQMLT